MKSEWKPIVEVWSTYSPTSFSQYAKNITSLKSIPSLHDVDEAEYSEYGFKFYFWDVQQRFIQSVYGITLRRMLNFIYV